MTETRFAKFFAILITVLLMTGCASPAIVAPTPTATTPPTDRAHPYSAARTLRNDEMHVRCFRVEREN